MPTHAMATSRTATDLTICPLLMRTTSPAIGIRLCDHAAGPDHGPDAALVIVAVAQESGMRNSNAECARVSEAAGLKAASGPIRSVDTARVRRRSLDHLKWTMCGGRAVCVVADSPRVASYTRCEGESTVPMSLLRVCRPRSAVAGVQRNARTARFIRLLDGIYWCSIRVEIARDCSTRPPRGESSLLCGG